MYWRSQISRTIIEPVMGGEPVPQTSPAFLEVLASSSKGNFVLSEGGYLLDPIDNEGLMPLTDYLFGLLVDPTVVEEVRDLQLDELCERLITETKLRNNPNFYRQGYQVQCPIIKASHRTVVTYEFNYAYKNGSLQRLYHRVPLSRQKMTLKKTVHDAAWMFERVTNNKLITPNQGGALIRLSEEQRQDKEVANILEELGSVTRLLNLDDHQTAEEFRELAALSIH